MSLHTYESLPIDVLCKHLLQTINDLIVVSRTKQNNEREFKCLKKQVMQILSMINKKRNSYIIQETSDVLPANTSNAS